MDGRVLILDDDRELLEIMCEFVRGVCGRECLALSSFDELVAAKERVLGCSVALLDVNLGAGQPSGIDAYRWLTEQGFAGKLYFFTGHARLHPLVQEFEKLGRVEVLSKPVDSEKLVEVLQCPTSPPV